MRQLGRTCRRTSATRRAWNMGFHLNTTHLHIALRSSWFIHIACISFWLGQRRTRHILEKRSLIRDGNDAASCQAGSHIYGTQIASYARYSPLRHNLKRSRHEPEHLAYGEISSQSRLCHTVCYGDSYRYYGTCGTCVNKCTSCAENLVPDSTQYSRALRIPVEFLWEAMGSRMI